MKVLTPIREVELEESWQGKKRTAKKSKSMKDTPPTPEHLKFEYKPCFWCDKPTILDFCCSSFCFALYKMFIVKHLTKN